MKKNKRILYILIAIAAVTSCKDYLDEPKPTDKLATTAVYSSREGVEAHLSGVYRFIRDQYLGYGVGDTDKGGLYSMYFARSLKGNDLVMSPSGWYRGDYEFTSRDQYNNRSKYTWGICYEVIKNVNAIIRGVTESGSIPAGDKIELIAEAKALRAFFHFQAGMEYQVSYEPALEAPPFYTEDDIDPKGMTTMEELFNFIVADINAAIEGLPDTRTDKTYVNLQVANGIKARILMYMGQDWEQVQAAANIAYGGDINASLDPANYTDGFGTITNIEWIWAMDQTDDQKSWYWTAPHSFINHTSPNAYYKTTYINTSFQALFSATDVRNTFVQYYIGTPSDWWYYITEKFQFQLNDDMVIMRSPEMILIEAEALYRQSNETAAHDLLFAIQNNRDVNAVRSSNTGNALLEEILVERRKELYAEIGVEWFDAKRLKRGVTRDGNHSFMENLKPNDKRFMLMIPQSEIDANDNISDAVNVNR